ncbi:MAG: tetratricopeptide repeat protein [Promethearchaeota archaeon]
MKPTNFTINNLFTDDTKLTFLVGAGCSVDAPSCLPAGRAMMEAIIKYSCAESELEKLLKLVKSGELRFESLVEIIRDQLDPELKLIDYYGQCNKPNHQHFFLAEMIKKGHFVMTTNFDSLIEYALLQSDIPNEEIIPVISKNDFEKYKNPIDWLEKGKKIVYKIHGSPNNIIKPEENTKDSLIATIQAFGSNKEGLNVFQVEPFKRDVFDNISNGRSLIIMGYSGSDDFDVVPTLKVIENLRNIVWISYDDKAGAKEQIYEIEANKSDKSDKVNQILFELKRSNNADHIYRANANTSELIENLLEVRTKTSKINFSLNPNDWLKEYVKTPNQMIRYYIPYKIYEGFDMYGDAMRCSEEILRISKKTGDESSKGIALNNIGMIYREQGNYPEALKMYEEALKIDEQLGNLSGKARALSNIAAVYYEQGNYPETLRKYEEVLKIVVQSGDHSGKATYLNNIGMIYRAQGNYPEALKWFGEALKIDEQLGNLSEKATRLNNIATIYYAQGNYSEALKRYEEALKINDQLGEFSKKASRLNNIGLIYRAQGNYSESLKRLEESLKIVEQLGDLLKKAKTLNNIGLIYRAQGNYPEALKRYEEALKIDKRLGNLSGEAARFNNIAAVNFVLGDYPKALNGYREALKIDDQLGELSGKATDLNNIGEIYRAIGNYPEALKCYEKALKIDEHLRNLPGKAIRLNNIASIHYAQGSYPEALKYFEKALQILIELGLSDSPNAKNFKENIKYLKSIMK